MKKTPVKTLEAQQKLFGMLAAGSRVRVINQLIATPRINLVKIARMTGVSAGAVHAALKVMTDGALVRRTADDLYYVDERVLTMIDDLTHDATEVQLALNKIKPRVRRSKADKETVISLFN